VLRECMTDAKIRNFDAAQSKLKALIAEIQQFNNGAKDKYVSDLMEDLTGQAFEAISNAEYYKKWGGHYIPSLINAHLHQYCNNFKDPGVQNYGGALFAKLKETGNEVFISLPPPKVEVYKSPYANYGGGGYGGGHGGYGGAMSLSIGSAPSPAQSQPVDMSKYYDVGGGCFHGDCQVTMVDGELKRVSDLKVNDVVIGGARIKCVVKHKCQDNRMRLCEYNGLIITSYHPIRIGGQWVFPIDVDQGNQREYECEFVYNFVLDSGHIMTVNGVEACTLGHNFKESAVIQHEYFGTNKVTDDLMKMKGWTRGLVTLHSGSLKRNEDSNMVEGLIGV